MTAHDRTLGELLGRCLRAAGARRVFGAPSAGVDGIAGLGHVRVDDAALAALLADAQGRVAGGAGVALVGDRTLRLSAQPGAVADRMVLDDPLLVPEAIATWASGSGTGAVEYVLDLDLDAPPPAGAEPLVAEAAGPLMTLSPTLRDFRTLVLAGPGVVRANQVPALRELAARTGAGVVNTWGAKGVLRWDSPHHFGTAGLQARDFELAGFGEAELVIAVGLDEHESPRARWAGAQVLDVEPFQLAALAYNWPDPETDLQHPPLYTSLAAALRPLYESAAVPLTPARAAADLAAALPRGGVVVADPGPAGLWVARTFPTTEPGSVVVPALAVRGFAAAGAIVAGLDGRPVIAVTTTPVDGTTQALLALAASFGVDLVLAEWGADAAWSSPDAHCDALDAALAVPGPVTLAVPVDFAWTRTLVEVAGEVVAWAPRPEI